MKASPTDTRGTYSTVAMALLAFAAGGAMLGYLVHSPAAWLGSTAVIVFDGIAAVAILVAAGGFGYLVVGRLAPASAAVSFRVVTACILGLWMLSSLVMIVGELTTGLLVSWLWWLVIAAGIVLAAWQGRRRMESLHLPRRTDVRAMVWVVIAVAAGIILAGATQPPSLMGNIEGDSYDVLEYHLQVPREYFLAGHVAPLGHNVYSFYPLGVEMLYLLGMVLRSGPYEGMYLAKLLNVLYAALAAGVLVTGFGRIRGRLAAALLVSTPIVVYLSWLAMDELAQIAALAAGVMWLLHWVADRSLKSAIMVGLMAGAAMATKYLAIIFVAFPLAAAMLLLGLSRLRQIWHLAPAAMAAILLFSPWLIRNAVHAGNPVFPLATQTLGADHWGSESQQRWLAGHSAAPAPPVPPLPGESPPPAPSRVALLWAHFIASDWFARATMIAAALAVAAWIARRGPTDLLVGAMLVIAGVQVAFWMLFARDMPSRFLCPITVPIVLLASDGLARLARVQHNPFARSGGPSEAGPWGLAPAAVIFLALVGINLVSDVNLYKQEVPPGHSLAGLSGQDMAGFWMQDLKLAEGDRIMLVGESRAFYFPPGAVYSTVFDTHPLVAMIRGGLTGEQIRSRLAEQHIDYVWVNWSEIFRLAATYGFPAELRSDMLNRMAAGAEPGTALFDSLGLVPVQQFGGMEVAKIFGQWSIDPKAYLAPGQAPASQSATWPVATIYRLPSPATQPD